MLPERLKYLEVSRQVVQVVAMLSVRTGATEMRRVSWAIS